MSEIIIEKPEDKIRRMAGLIWSMAGAGKTTFLSSAPQPILFFMLDPGGADSIPENCDHRIVDLSEQPDDVTVRYLKDKAATLISKQEDIKSVVVDSLTIYANRALNYAISQGVGESNKFKPTIEAPGLGAYGARRQYITHAVSNILRATALKHMHCFFTTHQDDGERNDKGEVIKYSMMLGGKAVNDAALQMGEVWWLRENDGKRFIAVRNCRMREPMKTRMFNAKQSAEFELKFDPLLGSDQPHSLTTWYNQWIANGRKKLELPK